MIFLVIFFEISANENTLLVLAAMLNLGSLKLDYDLILSSAFIQLHDWVTYMAYIISLYSSSPQPPSTNASSFIINSFSTYKFIIKIMLLFLRNQLTWVMKFYALKEDKRGYNVMLKQNINNKGIQIWFLSFSHFWDRPVPIFSDARFSYLALMQDKKNHVRFTGKCMLYSLCQLPPEFSMLFLFKINNSLYISFQSFINTQILTISHSIT